MRPSTLLCAKSCCTFLVGEERQRGLATRVEREGSTH
jgi:hypothetical protein